MPPFNMFKCFYPLSSLLHVTLFSSEGRMYFGPVVNRRGILKTVMVFPSPDFRLYFECYLIKFTFRTRR